MIEEIRCCLMERYVKMKQMIARYKGPICPRIQHKLEIEKINSRLWVAVWCGDEKVSRFEVRKALDRYVVDIEQSTCSCG